MRTQGEVEAQIGSEILKFYVRFFSRGPKSIQVNMLPDSAVVVTQNNFTNAEKYLISDGQQNSFKEMRYCLLESKFAELKSIIENAAGVLVKCMHHDITSEEEAFIFSLKDKPEYRLNGNGKFHFARS